MARFIRGCPAATEPGTTGGADTHIHAESAAGAHTHLLSTAAGLHTHDVTGLASYGAYNVWTLDGTVADGSHTHGASNSQGSHTHATITTVDGRPAYYEVAFIKKGAGGVLAAGIIIVWTGALVSIPAGFSLCDGGGGRPDLRGKFIRGVNTSVTNPGTTGGAATHQHTANAGTTFDTHTHTSASSGNHAHDSSALVESGIDYVFQQYTTAGAHTHTLQSPALSHTHLFAAANGEPPYYEVAYIYNAAATLVPTGGILLWGGLIATIPAGYSICDGAGGRPDLRSTFVKGSAAGVDPGASGGAATHLHTDQNTGAHTHVPNTQWAAHIHSLNVASGSESDASNATAGSHNHTASDSQGNHQHTIVAASSLPAYYELLPIIKT